MADFDDDDNFTVDPVARGDVLETPTTEEPAKEEPSKEEPVKEEPAKEEPAKEEPAKEEPAKEEPVKEEPAKETPKADIRIPKSRYDAAAARARAAEERAQAAERELAELRAAKSTESDSTATDLDAKLAELDEQAAAALADGDSKKAAQLMQEARKIERQLHQQAAAKSTAAPDAVTAEVQERLRYDNFVAQVETDFPQLNPDSERYDREATARVKELCDAFEGRGYRPSDALALAMEYMAPVLGAPASSKEEPKKEEPKPEPRKTDIEKNLKAAGAQPPDMGKMGLDSNKAGMQDKLDVAKIPEEEFDALPEDTKRRLRGDML